MFDKVVWQKSKELPCELVENVKQKKTIVNLENLSAAETGLTRDVVNAVVRASGNLTNLLKQLLSMPDILQRGKEEIVKKDLNSPVIGMKEIWIRQGKCLLPQRENISPLIAVKRSLKIDLPNGIKKTPKKEGFTTELCMLLKQESSFVQASVHIAIKSVYHMLIMRIIQNLMRLFGYVPIAILNYIINTNITVREQARKLCKQMRCSELLTKAVEICRNDISPRNGVNRRWQAGGKARFIYLPPGYNNDPCINNLESMTYIIVNVQVKLSLIDLEGYGESYADKAQATERCAA